MSTTPQTMQVPPGQKYTPFSRVPQHSAGAKISPFSRVPASDQNTRVKHNAYSTSNPAQQNHRVEPEDDASGFYPTVLYHPDCLEGKTVHSPAEHEKLGEGWSQTMILVQKPAVVAVAAASTNEPGSVERMCQSFDRYAEQMKQDNEILRGEQQALVAENTALKIELAEMKTKLDSMTGAKVPPKQATLKAVEEREKP